MRARIGALLFAFGIFALASRGHAAAVNIDVLQQAPGSTLWNLQLSGTGSSVGALSLLVSDSLTSFTPSPLLGPPPICALGVGGGCGLDPVPAVPGFNLLNLTFTPPLFPGTVLLGTFGAASSNALVQVLPADDIAGGTVFDANGNVIFDFSIRVVPEPAAGALFALAAVGLALRARRMD